MEVKVVSLVGIRPDGDWLQVLSFHRMITKPYTHPCYPPKLDDLTFGDLTVTVIG